jgi:hypothetical protein
MHVMVTFLDRLIFLIERDELGLLDGFFFSRTLQQNQTQTP